MNIPFVRKIEAIAALTIKQSVRSRIIPALAIILPAIIILTILNIKGDGTAIGQISIAIKYSLAFMLIIMSIATLWSGCAAIAREIEDKQLRLIIVKPIKKHEIWLGRWLGWLAINATLLTICGITLIITIHYKVNSQKLPATTIEQIDKTVLIGRRRITPTPVENNTEEIKVLLEKLKAAGEIPTDTTDEKVCSEIQKKITAANSVVPPAGEKIWHLTMPKTISPHNQISLNLKLHSPTRSDNPAAGTLTITTENKSDNPLLQTDIKQEHNGIYQMNISPEIFHGGENIIITFKNASADNSHTLVFTPKKSLSLLINESSFLSNLIRALLVMLCLLATLSAIGLTTSAIFSFPVATFIAITVIIAAIASHFFIFASDPAHAVEHHHHHGHEHEKPAPPDLVEKTGEAIIGKLRFIVEPTMKINVLQNISSGILITEKDTTHAIMILFLLYPGILGFIGSYILSKREMASLN